MRFDVNISLALPGADQLGTRAEIKNLNSFRSIERAVEYEYKRQSKLLDKGEKVIQETRGWSDATGETSSQRSKEEAQDYRYMPEPDIPPIHLSKEFIEKEKAEINLLPQDYRERLGQIIPADTLEVLLDYQNLVMKLNELKESYDADIKTDIVKNAVQKVANWFKTVLLAEENASLLNDEMPSVAQLKDLVAMLEQNELSSTSAKEVFLKFYDKDMHFKDTRTIAKELNVIQENDTGALEAIVDEVLADPATAQAQADFKAGQEKVIGFLVGQVMKASKGKANPAMAQQILRKKLQ
jgi:aspartyl-tRNA(Asn)/glutamyl-tRNA(Gln) amidotransferase subunit B